jgi:3-methyladenine DNA glycosylase AlkD
MLHLWINFIKNNRGATETFEFWRVNTRIFDIFRAVADPEKAVAMGVYMRDLFPFLGIPAPECRKLSREFLESAAKRDVDWDFVFKCWRQPAC